MLHSISQSKKCKEVGGQQKSGRAGTGIKGYGKWEDYTPHIPPPHLVRASNRCKEGHWFNSCLRTTPLEVKEISALMRGTCETVIKRG